MRGSVNLLGASLFWLYIIAALFFTGLVIYTIINLPGTTGTSTKVHLRNVAIFSTLACISFVTLSYNMLDVLIKSFMLWHQLESTASLGDIWTWSIESTLFRDFGEALFANMIRRCWTQAALSATMVVCLFMGVEGHRRSVPRLWAFFCLGQILPISFTQNLFYLALLRLPPPLKNVAVPQWPMFMVLLAYQMFQSLAADNPEWLMRIILAARLCLFAPLIICGIGPEGRGSSFSKADWRGVYTMLQFSLVPVLSQVLGQPGVISRLWNLNISLDHLQVPLRVLREHPAVSALGCDLLICLLSYGVWTWTSRTQRTMEVREDSKF